MMEICLSFPLYSTDENVLHFTIDLHIRITSELIQIKQHTIIV